MPKRLDTPDPEIKQYEDGTYIVRIGAIERSLRTKDWEKALKNKPAVLAAIGIGAANAKIGHLWPQYEIDRKAQKDANPVRVQAGRVQRKQKTLSDKSFKEIEDLFKLHLNPFFQEKRLSKLDEDMWSEYVDQCRVIDLANHRKVMRGFLKWCKRKKYVKYIIDLDVPAVERRERHVLRPAEIKKVFEHSKGSLLIFVSMYLFMGMRRKEIMTMPWSRVFFDEGYLMIDKSEVKTRRGRPLPLNTFVLELLKARHAKQGVGAEFVFPHRNNRRRHADLGGLKTAWNTCMRRCGFEPGYITPHDLRATFEAYMHKDTGFTDTQREKMAGAKIDVQKKIYVRFDASDVRGLEEVVKVDGLSKILGAKLKTLGKSWGTEGDESRP